MSFVNLFVYGTLQPGYENHNKYCRDRLLNRQTAKVRGSLYTLSVGYPGLAHGDQWVQGYLLTLREDGQTLIDLDELEDYSPDNPNSLYQRKMTAIFSLDGQFLGQAWVYFMAIATIQWMHGTPIPSGQWVGCMQN